MKGIRSGSRGAQSDVAIARGAIAYNMREHGATYEEVGKSLGGITAVRARQIYLAFCSHRDGSSAQVRSAVKLLEELGYKVIPPN